MTALVFAGLLTGTAAIGLVCGFIAVLQQIVDHLTDGRA